MTFFFELSSVDARPLNCSDNAGTLLRGFVVTIRESEQWIARRSKKARMAENKLEQQQDAMVSPIGSSGIKVQVGIWKITCSSSEEAHDRRRHSYETDM
jgi:hypothetical protein